MRDFLSQLSIRSLETAADRPSLRPPRPSLFEPAKLPGLESLEPIQRELPLADDSPDAAADFTGAPLPTPATGLAARSPRQSGEQVFEPAITPPASIQTAPIPPRGADAQPVLGANARPLASSVALPPTPALPTALPAGQPRLGLQPAETDTRQTAIATPHATAAIVLEPTAVASAGRPTPADEPSLPAKPLPALAQATAPPYMVERLIMETRLQPAAPANRDALPPGQPQMPAPALRPRQVNASPPPARQEPAPTIQITIGRIEIRAQTQPAAARPKAAAAVPAMGLDEYLRRRSGDNR